MRVLITGATGFVGSHVGAALRGSGHEVRILVRAGARVPRTIATVDVRTGDVTDAASVRRALDARAGWRSISPPAP